MSARKVLIVTGKGGVGKTTVAVNMGVLLVQAGQKVGLVDADIHSPNIPRMLGIKPQGINRLIRGIEPALPMEGLKVVSMALFLHNQDTPIAWRGPIKNGVIKQFIADAHWGELDFLIVDLPAGTGDEAMSTIHALKGLAGALVVTTPQALSLLEVRRITSFFRHYNVPIIGLMENMADAVCPHCERYMPPFGSGKGEEVAIDLDIPYLGSIPVDIEVMQCADKGEPFVTATPESAMTVRLREITSRCMRGIEERMGMTLVAKIICT